MYGGLPIELSFHVSDQIEGFVIYGSDRSLEYKIEGEKTEEEVVVSLKKQFQLSPISIENISNQFKHILSHQKIYATFYRIVIKEAQVASIMEKSQLKAYSRDEVLNLPKPKLIVNYLDQIGY